MNSKQKLSFFDYILYFLFIILGFITLYPFWNVIVLSFNNSLDSIGGDVYFWPRELTLDNYAKVFAIPTLMTGFVNSVLRTVIATFLGVLFSAMIAFAVSRKDFMLRKFVNYLFAITLYVSGGLIPGYMLIRDLHLMNNFLVYILPGLIWTFAIFVIRSYMDSLPISLQESAMLDGANDLVIFFRVILPLCKPVLATIALFYAVGNWNSWFDTYLFVREKSLTTLQFELQKLISTAQSSMSANGSQNARSLAEQNRFVTPQSLQMAITVVASFPIVIVYPFVQKYFVKGLTLGAVKS